MRYFVCVVIQFVLRINSSLLAVTLHFSVITTPVYNDTQYSVAFHDVITEFDSTTVLASVCLLHCLEPVW
jgi:hypothetical protein